MSKTREIKLRTTPDQHTGFITFAEMNIVLSKMLIIANKNTQVPQGSALLSLRCLDDFSTTFIIVKSLGMVS